MVMWYGPNDRNFPGLDRKNPEGKIRRIRGKNPVRPPDFTYGSALQIFLAHHRLSLTVYAYEAESPFRPAYVSEFPLMIDFLPPHDPTASLVRFID